MINKNKLVKHKIWGPTRTKAYDQADDQISNSVNGKACVRADYVIYEVQDQIKESVRERIRNVD